EGRRYELTFGAAARRALAEQLSERVASAVWAFCDSPLRDNPYRVGTALRAPLAGQYSARRGAYRVRYRVDDDKHLVTVVDIAYRAEPYHPGRA
ncbi:MAG TPA: type II toxin-antitoxin system RelE/ParE family toxin, partial [Jiangellaceae bacterium]|nr:type II toxin-antitoxin system RelE/ParE family toxin [Jiangellaceae bacterium]